MLNFPRTVAIVVALLGLSFVAVSSAQASTVVKVHREAVPHTGELTGVCDFSVHVDFLQTSDLIFFYDNSGTLTKVLNHVTETDTFSANGKALVGQPYQYNFQVLFDENGSPTVYANGVVSRIVFPGGTLFLSAGRIEWNTHTEDFLITPDFGATGDIGAFCDYFADPA